MSQSRLISKKPSSKHPC